MYPSGPKTGSEKGASQAAMGPQMGEQNLPHRRNEGEEMGGGGGSGSIKQASIGSVEVLSNHSKMWYNLDKSSQYCQERVPSPHKKHNT
jgi:hypothetical protein